jgi:hypothetical protein
MKYKYLDKSKIIEKDYLNGGKADKGERKKEEEEEKEEDKILKQEIYKIQHLPLQSSRKR